MKNIHILTFCLAVAGIGFLANSLLTSDFDRFAKQTIKKLGDRSDHQKATNAFLNFIEEKDIDDPVAYFIKYSDKKYFIDADDPNLSKTDRSYVRSGKVRNLTSFSSRYFNILLTSYDFRIRVWDLRSGERKITTQIYYNAP